MKLTRRQWLKIEADKSFLSRLFWEYRQQCLDQLAAMRDLGIRSSDERYRLVWDAAKDAAFISWHYAGSK